MFKLAVIFVIKLYAQINVFTTLKSSNTPIITLFTDTKAMFSRGLVGEDYK